MLISYDPENVEKNAEKNGGPSKYHASCHRVDILPVILSIFVV